MRLNFPGFSLVKRDPLTFGVESPCSPRDEERRKEMEMFGADFMGGGR